MKEIFLNDSMRELRLSIIFDGAESAEREFSKVAKIIEAQSAQVVTLEVFSAKWAEPAVEQFCKSSGSKFPVNWICPLDESAEPVLASAHITAISGGSAQILETPAGSVAVKYDDGFAAYVRTFGISTDFRNDDGYLHTLANLKELEKAVELFGCKYTDIARTWFYNDDILSWYPSFNKARTEFYRDKGVFDSLLPASTGIGAPNPKGTKITSGAIALLPSEKGRNFEVFEVDSPLQCGAPEYGSSFSRAVEIRTPKSRRVMISGTASIEPGGETAFVGDVEKQIDLTMRVIEAILSARGMDLGDVVHSVAYCLRPEYYNAFKAWLSARNIDIPHCPSFSIVCRHDLLFEVELEAAKKA